MINIKYKIFLIFTFLLILSLKFNITLDPVYAQTSLGTDIVVTCTANSNPCTMTPSSNVALFSESNWLPGDTVTQHLTIDNSGNSESCGLTLSTKSETQEPANFASYLFTSIYHGLISLYGTFDGVDRATNDKNLANLFSENPVFIKNIPAGTIEIYDWTVSFDTLAGNEFQNANTKFDFDMDFRCEEPSPTPEPSIPPSPTDTPNPTPTPEVCNAENPISAPSNLRIINTGINTVSLAWDAVTPVTHYALIFTRVSDGAQYGASNIGNITSYTITNLSGQDSYVFEVFGVNDCAPGDRSSVVSGFITGPVIQARPVGGDGQTLGTSDSNIEATTSATPTPLLQGEVEGTSDANFCQSKYYPWWIFLIIQLLIIIFYYWFVWRREDFKTWIIFPIFIAIISQLIHIYFGCNCAVSNWCKWYWAFNLIIFILPTIYYWIRHDEV